MEIKNLMRRCSDEFRAFGETANKGIKDSRVWQIGAYSLLFGLCFLVATSALWLRGKGFIWVDDGLEQQYTFFLLEGKWLRELLGNVFIEHSLVVPMWTNEVGYGADYLVSIMNTLGNPINLLSVFSNVWTADYLLNLTVPLTLYLAGLSFLKYCDYKELDAVYSIVGAVVYVFSAYSLLIFTQIYMLYVLVLAPLVLLGVDKVFDEGSPATYCVSMFAVAVYGVYQAYVFCILLVVYCLVRYVYLDEEKTLRNFCKWFIRIFGPSVLAIGMASFLFLPVADSILGQDRLSVSRDNSAFYSIPYYVNLFAGTITAQSVGSECFYGFAPLALFALLSLFGKEGGDRARIIRTLFVIFLIMLCIPLVGRFMNGMSYPSNRWVWAVSLLAGIAVAVALPQVEKIKEYRLAAVVKTLVLSAIVLVVLLPMLTSFSLFYQSLVVLLLVAVAAALGTKMLKAVATFSVLVSAGFLFYQWGNGVAASHVDIGRSYEVIKEQEPGVEELFGTVSDEDQWRYESRSPGRRNSNIAFNALGTSFYNSFYNSYIDRYHDSLGLASSPFNFSYNGLCGDAVIEAFAGVKYYVSEIGDEAAQPPFLFDTLASSVDVEGRSYGLWQSGHVLPMAMFLDDVMSEDQYYALSMGERKAALLDYLVVDLEEPSDSVDTATLGSAVDYEVVAVEGEDPYLEDGLLYVPDGGVTINLKFFAPEDSVLYLGVYGLDFVSSSYGDSVSAGPEFLIDAKNILSGVSAGKPRDYNVSVSLGDWQTTLWRPTKYHDLYGGKNDWSLKLPDVSGEAVVALSISEPGVYSMDSLQIEAMEKKSTLEKIDVLACSGVDCRGFAGNEFTCSVESVGDGGYLFFRIPYGKGWSATVDGVQVEVLNADVGFMAVKLEQGSRLVELNYQTPGFREGCWISAISWALFFSCAIAGRLRRKG